MLKKTGLAALVVMLAGCEPSADTLQRKYRDTLGIANSGRFKLERVQVVHDSLAYDDERGIYLLTDTQTGQEFVGISGIGISVLGRHSAGKTTLSDER